MFLEVNDGFGIVRPYRESIIVNLNPKGQMNTDTKSSMSKQLIPISVPLHFKAFINMSLLNEAHLCRTIRYILFIDYL